MRAMRRRRRRRLLVGGMLAFGAYKMSKQQAEQEPPGNIIPEFSESVYQAGGYFADKTVMFPVNLGGAVISVTAVVHRAAQIRLHLPAVPSEAEDVFGQAGGKSRNECRCRSGHRHDRVQQGVGD